MYRTDKITHSHACASQFTITANEALSMRLVCTCSAEANFDMMSVRVNDEWIVTGFAKPEGVTKEATYELAAGDTMEVLAQWVKDGSVDSGRDCAEITFISEGDFTIEKTEPTKTVAAGGSAGGWPKMPLRAELAPAVLPCFPENVREAAVVNQLDVYGMDSMADVISFLNGSNDYEPTFVDTRKEFYEQQCAFDLDFADVKGQEGVKRALEIAAAGGHNIIMIGSPGSGKSMMAKRLPGILPPLTLAESLETTQIHSVAGKLASGTSLISQRPFRSPHHTVSQVAMTGGTNKAQPGEVSLAHNGVLFCDELPEFNKSTLEVLRQPLEDRKITISRAKYTVEYPCSFMFVASMNPCPCGYYGDPTHHCVCSPGQISRYLSKISGPLLDRIDLHVEVPVVPFSQLSQMKQGESSATIRERVIKARQIQEQRFANDKGVYCNAQMTERMLHLYAEPDAQSLDLLRTAMERLSLSARAYSRILKVARTIADLEGSERIQSHHIAEAIGYRSLDRGDWAER